MSPRTLAGHFRILNASILWADEDAHDLLGYAVGALTDMPLSDVLALEGMLTTSGVLELPARGSIDRPGVQLIANHGERVTVDMRAERMDDSSILWSFGLADRGVRGERLDWLSRFDRLTRLPNRVPSLEELPQAGETAGVGRLPLLAVCYMDLDRFRDLNDSFGPRFGDEVLREAARRLKAAMPQDAAVARVGGDEFALVMSFSDAAACEALVKSLAARMAHPYRLQDQSARVDASFGVAMLDYGAEPTEVMLRHAQHAAYLAKREGGSRVRYFDAREAWEEQQDHHLREAVRVGLEEGQFFLMYQPKVDMREGKVIGLEALVRWHHPTRGLLQPGSFVPLIENHELVEVLGDWVIGEAMDQTARWLESGLQTSVSVNISPRHLLRPDFMERLMAHLGRHARLGPGVLELEILETTAVKDFAAVAHFISACRSLGVPVTMDDFGTGYSSLTYLRQLPVQAIKLDQSFVRGMLEDAEDAAIVKGILVMAHGMGRRAIAEGVESVAHGEALMALGCTLGQGFGIARPLDAAQVPAWIAQFEHDPPWVAGTGRASAPPAVQPRADGA